jgi:micrococcal nuclease
VKRLLVVVAVLALAAFAVWIVATSPQSVGDPPASAGAGHPGAPADAERMAVVSVTDGDTLRLRDDTGAVENVRLVGIDTPEVYPVLECYGAEAESELLRLAPIGSTLRVATDDDPFDDYDRLLLYLWNDDGVFVNLALVEGGFAEAIRVQPNDLHFDTLRAAEDAAASADLGMWSC